MIDKRILLASILTIAIVGIGAFAVLMNEPNLQRIPPPSTNPDGSIQIVSSGDLRLWAEAEYSQDFMPAIPPEGAPFYSLIKINITNTGDETIENIFAPRATIYYNATFQDLTTLNLTTVNQYFAPISISPGESTVIEFINDPGSIFSPSIEEGTILYSRVLVCWDGGEAILTTPPNELIFTH